MKKYFGSIIFMVLALSAVLTGCKEDDQRTAPELGSIVISNVEGNTIDVYRTETFQLKMSIVPENANVTNNLQFRYSTTNKDIFTVSSKGEIKGVGIGEAILNVDVLGCPNLVAQAVVRITERIWPIEDVKIDESLNNLKVMGGTADNIADVIVGDSVELYKFITFVPTQASNKVLSYSSSDEDVIRVSNKGVIYGLNQGSATITVSTTDGTNISKTLDVTVAYPDFNYIDRSGWAIATLDYMVKDGSTGNIPNHLIDGLSTTYLSYVKAGKSYGGVTTPKDTELSFTVDMAAEQEFDFIKIGHRTSNKYDYLRVWAITLEGSNDGEKFETIMTNVPVVAANTVETVVLSTPKSKYRYVKVIYANYSTASGSTAQVAEVYFGKKTF